MTTAGVTPTTIGVTVTKIHSTGVTAAAVNNTATTTACT